MSSKIISYCKFNLFLKILDYSKDFSKHKIFSIFVKSKQYYDIVTILETKDQNLIINYKDNKNNHLQINKCIVKRTILYFENYYKLRVSNLEINIKKLIPIGSGLGGASSNAATVLLYLYKKFKISPRKQIPLRDVATSIGSDVPFFLSRTQAALVSNFGDVVKPINLNNLSCNIIINDEVCKTSVVFSKYKQLKNKNIIHYQNDLMPAAFLIYPKLLDIYKSLSKKYSNVVMTGSGSAFVVIND